MSQLEFIFGFQFCLPQVTNISCFSLFPTDRTNRGNREKLLFAENDIVWKSNQLVKSSKDKVKGDTMTMDKT